MPEGSIRKAARPKVKKSILGRVLGLMLWPLLTVVLVVGALYLDRMHSIRELTVQQETFLLKTARQFLKSRCDTIASDLRFLIESGVLNSYLLENGSASKLTLSALFLDLLDQKPEYDQIRFLNLEGRELIRVINNENQHIIVGDNQLQDKKERYYVKDILSQPEGSIYVSPLDLNIEYGVIEYPPEPVIRFGAVVPGDENHRGGIVIINYRAATLLDSIREIGAGATGRLFLLNPDGYYLVGPGQEAEFGFMFPDNPVRRRDTFANHFPDTWEVIKQRKHGYIFQRGSLYSFSDVRPLSDSFNLSSGGLGPINGNTDLGIADRYQWFLVSEIPAAYFFGQKKTYGEFLFILAAALLIPSIVVCVFLAKARIRVKQEELLRYREHENHLADLESKVKQRTRELDDINLQLSGEIAERLSAEKQLKRSNELLSGMIESIDGIIYAADFDTHEILFANEYLKKLFGFDPVGRECWQFIHSNKDGPCEFCTNDKLLDDKGEPTGPYQWEYQNPFNKRWYAAKDQAIKWSNGKYVRLEIATDITEHKRLQHFLKEARKQAELTTGIRSRFVALVAHDLKSPFFSIIQMLKRILERETFSHRVHRQFLENIVENGHHMLQMIDNLLSMDRFETGEMKLEKTFFNVFEMGDEVLQNFRHLAFEKGTKLTNSIPAGSMLYADKYLYFVVLNNLLSNSVKFCDRGSKIELFIPETIRPMTIAVRDNGKGMSWEYAQNLFKADVKTSSRGTQGEKGSGLGLIFCRDILESHCGKIRVESERGVGTTFYVELPECSNIENKG